MNLWQKLKRAIGLKGGDVFTPVDAGDRYALLPGTRYNFAAAVRNGLDSNVVMAPIQWLMRTFPEAPVVIEQKVDQKWTRIEDHALELLLDQPNEFYDGLSLEMATVLSDTIDGNSYWLKARGRLGNVLALWYLPHWLVEPRWPRGTATFIEHYEYRPVDGITQKLPVNDVIHIRFGLDPRNPRKGLSPLRSLMREVYTDDEAANFSAAILKNMGIPGVVISPKDSAVRVGPDDVDRLKEDLAKRWSGDHRGEPMVMGAPTDVKQFGFDPNQLMLGNLRDIAEERVCAAIGIPAAVVGFGAGLQQTKVGATMRELRRLAWLQCIIPNQLRIGKQIARQLLPDFETNSRRFRVRFDTSQISAFQEEETEKARRIRLLTDGGILRLDRAQAMMGLEVDPDRAIYVQPAGTAPVPVDQGGREPGEGGDGGDGGDEKRGIVAEMAERLTARGRSPNGKGTLAEK